MYLEILILGMLRERPRQGREIEERVERMLGGWLRLSNDALHPALERLERQRAIRREAGREEGRADRHIYSLTEEGGELLIRLLSEEPERAATDETEFMVRVAFFGMIAPEVRTRLLEARREAIKAQLAHLQEVVSEAHGGRNPWAGRMITYVRDGMLREVEWLQELAEESASESRQPGA